MKTWPFRSGVDLLRYYCSVFRLSVYNTRSNHCISGDAASTTTEEECYLKSNIPFIKPMDFIGLSSCFFLPQIGVVL